MLLGLLFLYCILQIVPRITPGPKTNYQKVKEEVDALAGYRSDWFHIRDSHDWDIRVLKMECRFSFPILV